MGRRSDALEPLGDAFAWSLLDAAPDGILVVAATGEIAFANDQAGVLFGCSTADLVGGSVDDLVPVEVRGPHRAHRAAYQAHPQVRSMGVGLRLSALRRDGSAFDAEISLSPLALDGTTFVVAAVRPADVELRAKEAELAEARQAILLAEDHDRLARDLHDTVIQRLFAAGLSLQATAARSSDEATKDRLATTVSDLDDTIRELRNAIFALQSPDPGPSGVRGRILDVVADATAALGCEPRLEFAGALETIDEAIVEQLVPTVREALTNVARHARATSVRLSVAVDDEVTVTVTDDGVGPDGGTVGGHGLGNLAQRAEQLGGRAGLTPAPDGRGSRFEWRVPATPP